MIEPMEMAKIYWSRIKKAGIYEVEARLPLLSRKGANYWNQVLAILKQFDEKRGERRLH